MCCAPYGTPQRVITIPDKAMAAHDVTGLKHWLIISIVYMSGLRQWPAPCDLISALIFGLSMHLKHCRDHMI